MPELPEIETLKRSLEKNIVGRKITSLTQFRESLRYNLAQDLAEKTVNSFVKEIYRIAKYLVMNLSNDYSIIFHLGMTGRLTLKNDHYKLQKHDHIILTLDSGNSIVFNDARRFGMLYLSATNELQAQQYFKDIGLEPFSEQFNAIYLANHFKNKKTSVKTVIMNNKIVVGIGNIYASESLFLSKIHPLKQAKDLTREEIIRLIKSIIFVLEEAIKAGGTTLKDFVNGNNSPGYFKQKLNAYARKGLSCYICKATIIKMMQNGRATYFCPGCQKL